MDAALVASRLSDPKLHLLSPEFLAKERILLPFTLAKLKRMLLRLRADGFVSFAEA